MPDVYMPNIYINDQTVVIKKNGITYALKDLVKSMPKAIVSDENISREEWDKTIDKLIEINAVRDEDSKIFKGSDDKNSKNFMLVMPGQEIEFSSDEMRELYKTMGVSFEKTGDDIPECVIEMPDIARFKRIADSIHNVTMKSLGAIKDTIFGKDTSKIDSAKVLKIQKNIPATTSADYTSVSFDDEDVKERKLCTEIVSAGAIAITILLGLRLHKKIKSTQKSMFISGDQVESLIRSRNPHGVLTKLPQDLLSTLRSLRGNGTVKLDKNFMKEHPPLNNCNIKQNLTDKILSWFFKNF